MSENDFKKYKDFEDKTDMLEDTVNKEFLFYPDRF